MKYIYWIRSFLLYKLMRIKTRGVRIACISNNQVLLVRHRLHALWVFPGGAIRSNESPKSAAIRECVEESNLVPTEPIRMFGEYQNSKNGKQDIVYLFVTNAAIPSPHKFTMIERFMSVAEIAECRWFSIDVLPTNISISTKTRIYEIQNPHVSRSLLW